MVDKYSDNFEYTDDYTKWFSDYYPIEDWFECKVLTTDERNKYNYKWNKV